MRMLTKISKWKCRKFFRASKEEYGGQKKCRERKEQRNREMGRNFLVVVEAAEEAAWAFCPEALCNEPGSIVCPPRSLQEQCTLAEWVAWNALFGHFSFQLKRAEWESGRERWRSASTLGSALHVISWIAKSHTFFFPLVNIVTRKKIEFELIEHSV